MNNDKPRRRDVHSYDWLKDEKEPDNIIYQVILPLTTARKLQREAKRRNMDMTALASELLEQAITRLQ